ncbi:MAG: hypothetical protein HOP21_05275 [Methylotenera sp.]|nr:hypothetical protein [Methylotenera sp.]
MQFFSKLFNQTKQEIPKTLSWVSSLEGMNDLSAIKHATEQLKQDHKNELFSDTQYLNVLLLADEKIHTLVERITAHFIHIDNINTELEERITDTVFFYQRQIFLIYYHFIDNQTLLEREQLPDVLARTMFVAKEMIKWRYYNYQIAPINIWLELSQLYKIAEQQSLLYAPITIYSSNQPCTLASIYVNAYMLGSLETASFKRQQIDFVCKLLSNWAIKTRVDNIYDTTKHLFYIDLSSNTPAKRIRNIKPSQHYRYLCLDNINAKIELCISLIEFNITPKQPIIQELIKHKDALSTLKTLHKEWSRTSYKRQRREEDRKKVVKSATISYGFHDTCEQIKQNEYQQMRGSGKSFEERLASHYISKDNTENQLIYINLGNDLANITDESPKGLGVNIKKNVNEVNIGMLVGVVIQEDDKHTKIGTIRNIKPLARGDLHIGIEMISNHAYSLEAKNVSVIHNNSDLNLVNIKEKEKPLTFRNTTFFDTDNFTHSNFGSDSSNFTCLYFPADFCITRRESLLIPRQHYNKNDLFSINFFGENTTIRFTKSFEYSENWVRVTFTKDIWA